jgi:lambda family phage portal protein
MKLLDKLPWRRIRSLEAKIEALEKDPFRQRNFNAAGVNRLTGDWPTVGISIDSLMRRDLETLAARCEEQTRNNPYFSKFQNMVLSNVLGHEGITLKNKASDPIGFQKGAIVPGKLDVLANKLIEDAFWDWGKKQNCTVAKDTTWLEAQQLSLRTWTVRGEPLWRMVTGPEAENKYNFALQPIATSRIDHTRNENLPNGAVIRMGVQKDSRGRKTHLWLFDSDPTDNFRVGGLTSKPYAASEFVHPMLVYQVGQTRAVPPSAPALLRAKMLDGYEEAHLEGTRAAACKMGFLKKTGDGSGYTGPEADQGGKYMDAEPGMLEELPMGMEFQAADWGYPNGGYGEFVKDCLRGIAAGLNVSYNTIANDLEGVNFSSGRLGLMDEREFWKLLQSWFSNNFCNPIFSKWLEMSLLSGAIALELPSGDRKPLPLSKYEKFNQPCWHGRRWQWVDPTKEVQAKEMEMANYVTSPTRVLAETGQDEDEVLEEAAAFLKKCDLLGLPKPRWALDAKAQETIDKQAETDAMAAEQTPAKPKPQE